MSSWSDGNEINTDGSVVGRLGLKAPSYIMWLNGTNYEAIDSYGKIAYGGSSDVGGADGSDSGAVAQAATDAIESAGGGWLHFKAATYSCTGDPWLECLTDGMVITGEGYGTLLDKDDAGDFIHFGDGSTEYTGALLANLHIQGIATCLYGVKVNRVRKFTMRDVIMDTFSGTGAYCLYVTTQTAYIDYPTVVNSYLTGQNPIKIIGADGTNRVNAFRMIGGSVARGGTGPGTTIGIDIQHAGTWALLDAPNISGFGTGLKVQSTANYGIISGRFENNTTDINIGSSVSQTRILDRATTFSTTPVVTDSGVETHWPRLVAPFIDGTAYDDHGWDIDAGGEYATAFINLPNDLHAIVRMNIYAYSVVTEADAMRLEITMNGAGDNEAYNTEAISVADKASASTNFAAGDIIYWTLTSTDDSDIGDLDAGDSLEIKVLHEAAGGDDCATDARFRTVEIQYI